MKRRILPLMLGLILTASLIPGAEGFAAVKAPEDSPIALNEGTYEEGTLLLVTEKGATKEDVNDLAEAVEGDVDHVSSLADGEKLAAISVEDDALLENMEELQNDENVRIVQPNYIYYTQDIEVTATADDGRAGEQDYLKDPRTSSAVKGAIDAYGAWDEQETSDLKESEKPLVAIIDTGLDLDHEDLQKNIEKNKCVTFNDKRQLAFDAVDGSYDDDGHGTHVGGVIAATTNNKLGVAGVAANQVRLFAVDVAEKDGGITSWNVIRAIDYSIRAGAKLINISLGDREHRDPAMEDAVELAWKRGTLCICAAGNAYHDKDKVYHAASDDWLSPGDSPYAISVMNHEIKGGYHYTSNYGAEKDVSAPGTSILSTVPGAYAKKSGTSMAAPVVTGIAALLLAEANGRGISLTPRQLKNLIYTSSGNDQFSADPSVGGFGHVNARTALRNLKRLGAAASKLVLNKTSIAMNAGESESLEYEVLPGNTSDVNLRYSSADPAIATVDSDGTIKAVSNGVTQIIATTEGGQKASCLVTVGQEIKKSESGESHSATDQPGQSNSQDSNKNSNSSSNNSSNNAKSGSTSNSKAAQKTKTTSASSSANTAGGTISTAITDQVKAPKVTTAGNYANKIMTVQARGESGVKYYRIAYRKAGATVWKDRWVGTGGTGIFSKLKKGELWEYRVAAYRKINGKWYRSQWSPVDRRYIAQTKAVKKRATKKGFSLILKKVKGATGYQLSYAAKSFQKDSRTITHGKTKVKFRAKKLKAKKKYLLRYRPIKKVRGKNYLGIWMNSSIQTK